MKRNVPTGYRIGHVTS